MAHERVLVDLTAPLGSLTFKVLEAAIITAVVWIIIGILDGPQAGLVPIEWRNAVVAIWAGLVCWRLGLPLVRARRQLFQVTDRRVRVRAPGLGTRTDSIALASILDCRRMRRQKISLTVLGVARPLIFDRIAHAKKVAQIIQQRLR
ncbi:hypothetical protein CATYP_02650 [Corynebacterium atypicum]|uniref:DUF304 domain-containing protein n=1 Tax=Corynebacterium atypicum TaxID=191610 RepID=A0ABM5QLW4_9CORY|nr:hypothetical protein [Corynebacterium atypicum]AIG63762.1 hypothetical protein CATYP_02650 [Corynebacterium atypicum]